MIFRFKKLIISIGIVAAVLFGINAAYNKAHGADDHWNTGIELQLFNPYDKVIVYDVRWLDHDIEKYKGQWVIRCGGELAPFERYVVDNFSLGLGRHYVLFTGEDLQTEFRAKTRDLLEFTVKANDKTILLTPQGIIRAQEIPDEN